VVELAFDGGGCLAVSFCIEIYAFGVVLGYCFNLCVPVVGVLSIFSFPPGPLAVFLREGHAG
jgi:hypothetical protein